MEKKIDLTKNFRNVLLKKKFFDEDLKEEVELQKGMIYSLVNSNIIIDVSLNGIDLVEVLSINDRKIQYKNKDYEVINKPKDYLITNNESYEILLMILKGIYNVFIYDFTFYNELNVYKNTMSNFIEKNAVSFNDKTYHGVFFRYNTFIFFSKSFDEDNMYENDEVSVYTDFDVVSMSMIKDVKRILEDKDSKYFIMGSTYDNNVFSIKGSEFNWREVHYFNYEIESNLLFK